MATYEESGVNISLGDKCSSIAYNAAKNTFPGRKGMIGQPVADEGGFTGAIDMGDYYLLQNSDGVGSKIVIAEKTGKFDTLGYDLLAMVVDDAACVGAETISITNTIDVNSLDENRIGQMMKGLEAACLENNVIIAGGEIAEMGKILNNYMWNSSSVGIINKHKIIDCSTIKPGDKLIGLKSAGIRSNGFSLVRYILEKEFGPDWYNEKFNENKTWGEEALTPSIIYSSAILDMHGRFNEDPMVELKGIVHVTGGGIPGNLNRILKKCGLGAKVNNLPQPHDIMKRLITMGDVSLDEAYKTWNMGIGMIIVSNEFEKVSAACAKRNIQCQLIGEMTASGLEIEYPKF